MSDEFLSAFPFMISVFALMYIAFVDAWDIVPRLGAFEAFCLLQIVSMCITFVHALYSRC